MRRGFLMASVLALAALGMLIAPAQASADELADLDAKIAAAKTPADHEAIAVQYDALAKDAHTKAEEHRKMAQDYRKEGGLAAKQQLPAHCEGLVRIYTSAAKDYAAMAKAHREMAKHVK